MRAIFLDKDGTLIRDIPYNANPELIQLLPGVAAGLRALHDAGYRLIVITNQSGVARGYFSESAVAEVEARLRQLFNEAGAPLSAFYYCPHHPDGRVSRYAVACACRKPEPGLIVQAARTLAIDLAESWFIGDILDDVEAGRRAGCQTILVDNGHETEWRTSPGRTPHHVVHDFVGAVNTILTTQAIQRDELGRQRQTGTENYTWNQA